MNDDQLSEKGVYRRHGPLPIVIGITGASGAIYGVTLVKFLVENNYKVDLVLSSHAPKVFQAELGLNCGDTTCLAMTNSLCKFLNIEDKKSQLRIWEPSNVAASISSGSYKTQGMIIAPCSMGTLGNIAAGTSNNLITRAADVTLKERRKLLLLARETPLNTIHLRNMLTLSKMGAIIMPAAPGFYHNPQTIQDQINFVIGKVLDVFDIDNENFKRWLGSSENLLLKI